MRIDQAQNLKPGQRVRVPADYGQRAYTGHVEHIGAHIAQNVKGDDYVWVTVRAPSGNASV